MKGSAMSTKRPSGPRWMRFAAMVLCVAFLSQTPSLRGSVAATPTDHRISVVSFNIQFLGNSKARKDAALVDLLAPYDVVIVQELVAPPYAGTFPNGDPYKPDPEAARFFDLMKARGFSYVLSEEDTGSTPIMHVNGTATEWWVVFYKPSVIKPASDLTTGFLAADRYDNPDYERVPYAFGFRAGSEDLVFVSVHLQPGGGRAETARRAQEIGAITAWITTQAGSERDYVVLGDMNIEDCEELAAVLPSGFVSLNDGCLPTNTNVNGPKPYDHVMFSDQHTSPEMGSKFEVINLVEAMRGQWLAADGVYPGDPYKHDPFRGFFSDHNPVAFEVIVDGVDDD